MKYLTLIALAILFAGCHLHDDNCYTDQNGLVWCEDYANNVVYKTYHEPTEVTYVYDNDYTGGSNNIIIVEDSDECLWEPPFGHDPVDCDLYGYNSCCTWEASSYGLLETYCYNDYCGWELEEVYTYY
tara:strand:- start:1855 stop:2238 length:384 start_codon:yes stop_codon:yes gene_type:complete